MSEGEYLRHKGTLVPLYLPTSYHCFTFFAMIFITKFCRFGVFITFSLLLHNWNRQYLYISSPLVFCARLCYGKSSNLENLCSTTSESVLSDTRYAILKA